MKAFATLAALAMSLPAGAQQRDYPVRPVPFTAVETKSQLAADRLTSVSSLTANRRLLKSVGAAPNGSALKDEAVHPDSGIGHWREELADKRHRFFLVYSY